MKLRPAGLSDLETVVALCAGAARWLASRGIDQWQFPPHRDRILHGIEQEECFLAFQEGRPIATITVDELADPEFWTPQDEPEQALYVHRMATERLAAGCGVGAALLDWAGRRAQLRGKQYLRLDAWKDNPGLHDYYRSQGFSLLRIVDHGHRRSGALFQRLAAHRAGYGPEVIEV